MNLLSRLEWRRRSIPRTLPAELPIMGRTLILACGPTPSRDYLLHGLCSPRGEPALEIDPDKHDPRRLTLEAASSVVVVRYLPSAWGRALKRLGDRCPRVTYFMDDDLMDPRAVDELPQPYRSRVRRDAMAQRSTIEAVCTEYWVSTPYLADKYASWRPRVLTPRPPRHALEARAPVWIVYHGTASHQCELEWLLPLMQQVQAQSQNSRFEVIGDHAVYKRFRVLPRVNVLHPMTWPNYLDYTGGVTRQIGLAPLLPTLFNAGRGPTKFFDFARMGAVGVYTDTAPYRGFVRHGVDGLLLDNDPAVWARAIADLASDAPRREAMAAAARARAMELAY